MREACATIATTIAIVIATIQKPRTFFSLIPTEVFRLHDWSLRNVAPPSPFPNFASSNGARVRQRFRDCSIESIVCVFIIAKKE